MKQATGVLGTVAAGLVLVFALWGDALVTKGRVVARDVGEATGLVEPEKPKTARLSIRRDGGVIINGEAWGPSMAEAKTQVTNEIRVSGKLGVYNQHDPWPPSWWGEPPTVVASVTLGQVLNIGIVDITLNWIMHPEQYPDAVPPANFYPGYVFAAGIAGYGPLPPQEVAYYWFNAGNYIGPPGPPQDPTPTPWEIELEYTMNISANRVWREQTHAPTAPRTSSPVYLREVAVSDEWVSDPPGSYSGTFGEMSISGAGGGEDPIPTVEVIDFFVHQKAGTLGAEYVKWDLVWDNGQEHHFDGRAYAGSNIGFVGDGKTVTMSCNSAGYFDEDHTVSVGAPLIFNFANYFTPNRDDASRDNLRVSGGFKATNHYPETLGWSTTP